jgi:hypothetical protein
VSIGRALGAATVSAIPLGGAAAKGVKGAGKITASMVGRSATREAVKGAAMGGTEATIRTAVDEGRMPTKEEYAAYVGGGAVFGGAMGAAMPKIGKSMDKFFGKTAREIDNDIAAGLIEFKDLKRISAVEGADGEKILRGTVEKVKARVRSEAAAALITESPASRTWNKLLSIVAPSKVVGKEARNEALSLHRPQDQERDQKEPRHRGSSC